MDLFFFPKATSGLSSAPKSVIVTDGYTLCVELSVHASRYVSRLQVSSISPSVYIGFKTLAASDLCGAVGPRIVDTTIGFAPGELSTIKWLSRPFHRDVVSHAEPLTLSDLERNCSSIAGYKHFPDNPYNAANAGWRTQDPCHPLIALPTRVLNLQAEWASCGIDQAIGGFYDPPRALTPATTMDPALISGSIGGSNSNQAAPASTPTPATPSITQTSALYLENSDPNIVSGTPTAGSSSFRSTTQPEKTGLLSVLYNLDPVAIARISTSDPHDPSPRPAEEAQPERTGLLSVLYNLDSLAIARISTSYHHGPSTTVQDPRTSQQANSDHMAADGHLLGSKADLSTSNPIPSSEDKQATIQHQNPAGVVIVNTHTLTENGPSATIDGAMVGYQSGSLVVGSMAVPAPTRLQQQQDSNPKIIGSLTFSALAPGNSALSATLGVQAVQSGLPGTSTTTGYIVSNQIFHVDAAGAAIAPNGATLSVGGPAITREGTPISLGSSGLVVGTSTASPQALPSPSAFTVNGQTFSIQANGAILAPNGATVSLNAPALTASGIPISLGPDGLVVGSSSITPFPPSPTHQSIYDALDRTYTLNPSKGNLQLAPGATLTLSGPALTISGTAYSLAGDGKLIIGTSTITPSPAISSPTSIYIAAGQTYTADTSGRVSVAEGKYITPGGAPLTLDGTVYALGTEGLSVNGSLAAKPTSMSGLREGLGSLIVAGLGGGAKETGGTKAKETGANASYTGPLAVGGSGGRVELIGLWFGFGMLWWATIGVVVVLHV